MAESTVHFRRGRGFTTIYNSMAQDPHLTLAARGLFTMIASLPQDWDYTVSGLAVKANTTRYEVRKCLENLQEAGYLLREQSHDSGGKFAGNTYVLQEESPTVVPICHNGKSRQRCLPLTVDLTQQSKDLNKEKTDKAPIPPAGVDEQSEMFERFWKAYPLRDGRYSPKPPALRAWKKLKPDIALLRQMLAALERQKQSESWTRENGRYIPMAATWLNQRRWETEPVTDALPEQKNGRRYVGTEIVDGVEVDVYE